MTEETPKASRIVKHSTIYALGNIARQLVGFLMLPIYTRHLTPSDYGVVGLLTFAMSIMEPFFGARLGEAMPKYFFQEKDQARKNAVISTALIITGLVSASTSLILFFFRDQTSSLLFGSSDFGLAVGLFGILILTQAMEYYGMTFIRILQRPTLFISISLSKLVLQLGLNISLVVWLKLGVMGVVISGVVSSSLYAMGLGIYIISHTGVRFDATLAKAMLKFSWPLWFVGLASLYIYSGNRYYIRVLESLHDVGLYELATKFATILTFLVWVPFNQFWETERFNYYKHGNTAIFPQTFQLVSFLLIAAALCIGITAEPIIRIMSDKEFHEAHIAVPILTIALLFSCLTNFSNFSFMAKDETKKISYIGYLTAVVITALNFLLIPLYGYTGAAFALAIALLFQFFVTQYTGRKYYDMNLNLRPTVLLTVFASVVFLASTYIFHFENIWLDIAAKLALLVFSLTCTLFMMWKTESGQLQLIAAGNTIKAQFNRVTTTS